MYHTYDSRNSSDVTARTFASSPCVCVCASVCVCVCVCVCAHTCHTIQKDRNNRKNNVGCRKEQHFFLKKGFGKESKTTSSPAPLLHRIVCVRMCGCMGVRECGYTCVCMCMCVYVCMIQFQKRLKLHRKYNTLQHTAIHCNTPQHTATHCNTLQDTARH